MKSWAASATNEPLESGQAALRQTVLLTEDEPEVREVAVLLLHNLGYNVLEARTDNEALVLARTYPQEIHLLMTDLNLGSANGNTLAERFSEIRPQTRVLFVSGSPECEVPEKSLGAHRKFLGKPYLMADLKKTINELLS